jgi:histidyl-tRNA synthetase
MQFKKVKGATDFFPADETSQSSVFDAWDKVARRHAFQRVEPAILETMGLLTKKSGQEIKEQIFTLDKRSSEELGLRYEFTASLARMFIEKQKELPKPVRWHSIGRVWRYEQPQAGRQREFFQYDAEIFGSKSAECDAEIILLAIESLKSLGLKEGDFTVYINNRKLLQGILEPMLSDSGMDEALRLIDKREKISAEVFRSDAGKIGLDGARLVNILDMDFTGLRPLLKTDLAKEGYAELEPCLKMLPSCARFSLSTARGLAYYTGTVFEIFDKDKKYRALCGGGRYDGMVETFGGESTPATGFGMGYSTVSLLLRDKGLLSGEMPGPEYFVAVAGADVLEVMELVRKMRLRHSVSIDLNKRNLVNQLKYANAMKARKVIVIGPDELRQGSCKIKDMASGKEVTAKFKDLF